MLSGLPIPQGGLREVLWHSKSSFVESAQAAFSNRVTFLRKRAQAKDSFLQSFLRR